MKRFLVAIFGKDFNSMADLVSKHKIDIMRRTVKKVEEEGGYRVDAIVTLEQMKALEARKYKVEIREDMDETAKARRKEIGIGDRYKHS